MLRKQVKLAALAAGLAGTATLLFMQWVVGAWDAGWGSNADSPAHVVSALVVREYVREGIWEGRAPMEFAREFYQRFPKVAIGHWPPMFHGALGLWMIATPLTQGWILGFQAVLAGVVAGLTVILGSMVLGVRNGALAGIVVAASPSIVAFGRLVVADLMVAAWVTAGLTAFAYYWRKPGWQTATLFGLCAAGALLTKPSGIMLAFTPPLCVLASRRWSLLRERSFWWPAVLVTVLYGPWHFTFVDAMMDGWRGPRHAFNRFVEKPEVNLLYVIRVLGVVGALSAAYGAWLLRKRGTGTVLACTVAGTYLLHTVVVPSAAWRHYVPLAPVLAVLAVAGAAGVLRAMGRGRARAWTWLILLLVIPMRQWGEREPSVSRLVDDLLRQSAVEQTWLVTGSSEFEGDVSAASALRRPADGLTVYRGSKLFLRGGWAGTRAQLTAGSPEQAETLIERCRIEVIILGKGTPLVVGDAVGRDPARWKIRKTGLNPELGIVFERVGGARAGLGEPLVQEP